MDKTEKAQAQPQRFCREQLIRSGMFPQDVARAVLKDREYTVDEATRAVQKYYEREVR